MKSESGVSLVEALISFVILGFLMTAMMGWYFNARLMTANINARDRAMYKAQLIIDSLNATGINKVSGKHFIPCSDTISVENGERNFVCTYEVKSNNSVDNYTNYNVSNALGDFRTPTKSVLVTVEWKILTTNKKIMVEGLIE